MDPKAMIESYVDDVVRHLPGNKRKDVGAELQSLLRDELAGREGDAGRAADEEMTLEVLRSFGTPDAVAERYRDAGPVIIRGADARKFTAWALGGVALQWAVSFWEMVIQATDSTLLNRVAHWWTSAALISFWWPGVLVTSAIIGAYLRENSSQPEAWTPKPAVAALDPDRVERGSMAMMLVLFAIAVLFALALPSVLNGLAEPFHSILAPDQGFIMQRTPLALVCWVAQFAIYIVAFRAGRWSRLTHRLSLAVEAAWVLVMAFFVLGGPIMVQAEADGMAKGVLTLTALFYLVTTALKLRRELIRVPAQPTA